MGAWLFQGNPKNYTVDEYLREHQRVTWHVNQPAYENQMNSGGQAFIWRADGGHPGTGGVVAIGILKSRPGEEQDDGLGTWFQKKPAPAVPSVTILLQPVRLTEKEGFLSKRELLRDPVLRNLGVIRMPHATNYKVTEEEAERLVHLWETRRVPKE